MLEELEKEFKATTRLLLGEALEGIDNYSLWLARNIPLSYHAKSCISGKEVWLPPPEDFIGKKYTTTKVISLDEMNKLGHSPYNAEELKDASVKDIVNKFIKPVAYVTGNYRYEEYKNVEKCSGTGGGMNMYYCEDVYLGVKNVAYCKYGLRCHNVFGCHRIIDSNFVIKGYNSNRISRCLEIDNCTNSSGLLFCHNCENVHDSMFCFNTKNLRYAIGNTQVQPKRYNEIKTMFLKAIAGELKKTKNLKLEIYNIDQF